MNKIKAIETKYNGYRFRSRLEARWAVFFDALGVDYIYEPEGYENSEGIRYLPDFKVKCHADRGTPCEPYWLYVEVKGEATENDAEKIKGLSCCFDMYDKAWAMAEDELGRKIDFNKKNDRDTADRHLRHLMEDRIPILVVSNIPNIEHKWQVEDSEVLGCYKSIGNGIYPFNYDTITPDHFGAFPTVRDGKFGLGGDEGGYCGWGDNTRTKIAYQIARKVRFEHGETPTAHDVQRMATHMYAEEIAACDETEVGT